jgi:hypothetical protein
MKGKNAGYTSLREDKTSDFRGINSCLSVAAHGQGVPSMEGEVYNNLKLVSRIVIACSLT